MPKGRHFGSQNGAKIDQKKRCKFKSEKVTSWSRLGAILGRFPRCLGVKNVDFSLVFKGFRENSLFQQKIVSRAVLGPTWHDVGRFWLPFGHLFGTQNGQKTMLKKHQKKDAKKERK